jgi:hypothetical protein
MKVDLGPLTFGFPAEISRFGSLVGLFDEEIRLRVFNVGKTAVLMEPREISISLRKGVYIS